MGDFASELRQSVQKLRGVNVDLNLNSQPTDLLEILSSVSSTLRSSSHEREADALQDVREHCLANPDFGGLGYAPDQQLDETQRLEVLFLVSSYLEALNSQDRYGSPIKPLDTRPAGRRGMTLAEKIFAAHDVQRRGEVKPGDVIRVDVDWVMASELSWSGMDKTYQELGKPGIFRNDRFWLAGDHVVDPRIKGHPRIKPLVEAAETARQIFKLTEFQGFNYTISKANINPRNGRTCLIDIWSQCILSFLEKEPSQVSL